MIFIKKTIGVLAAALLLFTSACSGGGENTALDTPKPEAEVLSADMLMTIDDVKTLVSFEPVASQEKTASKTSVRYDSDPIGQDPVIVELYAPDERQSAEDIYQKFTESREKRPKAEDVPDIGDEAYIAFPSLKFYRDGYMVAVTAGSGSGDEQKELLKSAALIAAGHLDEYLKAHPPASPTPSAE